MRMHMRVGYSMIKSDVIYVLVGVALIGLAITCGNWMREPIRGKWDIIIERCHDVDGRDYSGCLERENLEWSRGGKSGAL